MLWKIKNVGIDGHLFFQDQKTIYVKKKRKNWKRRTNHQKIRGKLKKIKQNITEMIFQASTFIFELV